MHCARSCLLLSLFDGLQRMPDSDEDARGLTPATECRASELETKRVRIPWCARVRSFVLPTGGVQPLSAVAMSNNAKRC
jgi:hypothetical protein